MDIYQADLSNPAHQEALLSLLDRYSRDPMGAGKPLPEEVRKRLIPGLVAHPTTLVFLASVDGEPAGLANCFLGFSTFVAKQLLNVHDLAVAEEFRGRGIGRSLLQFAAEHARQIGCCKVTLEVLEQNLPAKALYESEGFRQLSYERPDGSPGAGGALFMAKSLG